MGSIRITRAHLANCRACAGYSAFPLCCDIPAYDACYRDAHNGPRHAFSEHVAADVCPEHAEHVAADRESDTLYPDARENALDASR